LLDAGADATLVSSHDLLTPLHSAAGHGDLQLAMRLITAGADPNAVTADGSTPLDYAMSAGAVSLVEALRDAGVPE